MPTKQRRPPAPAAEHSPTAAEDDLARMSERNSDGAAIGLRLRELRKAHSVTLQQLAESIGVSVGYVSQIERNRSRLPVGVLLEISHALGVPVSSFFEAGPVTAQAEADTVVRKGARRRLVYTGTGVHEELLTPNPQAALGFMISTLEPGADSGAYSHQGEECGLVLEGRLQLWVGERLFLLKAGDSFAFKSTEVHRGVNPYDEPARIAWVTTNF